MREIDHARYDGVGARNQCPPVQEGQLCARTDRPLAYTPCFQPIFATNISVNRWRFMINYYTRTDIRVDSGIYPDEPLRIANSESHESLGSIEGR